MIIFLYGPDSYRKNIKLNMVVNDYKKKHSSFAVERFCLSENDAFSNLEEFVKARSLFDNMKLGIVNYKTLPSKKDEKELIKILKDNLKTEDISLIILSERKPTKAFNFLIEKPAIFQEFDILKGSYFREFFNKESKARGLEFDRDSQDLLAEVYEGNNWGLITELDKLSLLNNKKITKKTLEEYIDVSLPIDIFRTLGEISDTRDVGNKLSSLENLFERSEDLAMIFNFLSVFVKSRSEKKKMADYDVAIKSGKLEYEEALVDFILN